MVKASRGTQEAGGAQEDELASGAGWWHGRESFLEDGLDPADVNEIEVQRALAGAVEARASVFVAEPQELLRLAEIGPRKGRDEEAFEEAADVRSEAPALADHAVGIAHRIRRELLGIVVIVGRAAAWLLPGVRFDERAVEVRPHEFAIDADPDGLVEVGRGDRVDRFVDLDVVIGMDLALDPRGRIEARTVERLEGRALGLEADERALAGRAVDAGPRGLRAPTDRLAVDVGGVEPGLAAEEVFADVLHIAFDVGLAGRVPHDGGIDHEAAMARILFKSAGEDGLVAIGLGDRGAQIVEHDAGRDAPEILPGVLQPRHEVGDLLRRRRVDVLVPTVDERDEQRVDDVARARDGVGHKAEPSEVDLGQLARRDLCDAHRHPPPILKAELRGDEAVQRTVRHRHALAAEQRVHLREPQPAPAVLREEPLLDPGAMGREQHLAGPRPWRLRDRLQPASNRDRQRVGRLRRSIPPERAGRDQVAPDRFSGPTRRALDRRVGLLPV